MIDNIKMNPITSKKNSIKLAVFDFDGTLCDSKSIIVKTLKMTQEKLGFPISSDEACAATIGLPLAQCFLKLLPHLSSDEAANCAACYRRIFEDNKKTDFPPLFPHVMETLQILHEAGIRLAIATSRAHQSLMRFVERYQMTPYMEICVGSDDVANPKPAPDPVVFILERTGISAANTLVVGDMSFDILMGNRAGVHTCGVTYGNGTRQELTECKAEYIADEFNDIIKIIL